MEVLVRLMHAWMRRWFCSRVRLQSIQLHKDMHFYQGLHSAACIIGKARRAEAEIWCIYPVLFALCEC